MLPNKRQAIVFVILAALVFSVSLYKIVKVKNNSHFNPSSPGSLYYSESAFQYRYAEMVANGGGKDLFNTLRNDTAVQYPETVNVFKYETIMMELFYGFLYRICNFGLSFHLFLIYANCFFSSLPLILVFLITNRLFKNNIAGLCAALFYATTPISYLRTAAGSFLREDFTMVFLLLSVLLLIRQLNNKPRPILSVCSGLVIAFNLSSWHLTGFIYISMLPFFFWLFITKPNLLRNFLYTSLVVFIAGLTVPVLTTANFITSIFMCGLYALAAAYFLGSPFKKPLKRALLFLIIFAAVIGIRSIVSVDGAAYSHVFDMFTEKLKFFLKKPDDPSLLSFGARQLWVGAFNSPTPEQIWFLGRMTCPLGLIGAVLLLWKEKRDPGPGAFIASLSIIFFLLSMMAERILFVAAPFMAITLWGCALFDNKKHYLKFGLCFLLIPNLLGLDLGPMESGRYVASSYRELFKWINSNTRPDDAFAAYIHVSPMILLHTGRPEILHPKFENLSIRKKYEEFIRAIYSDDEDRLFEFCKKNRAKYLIYNLGFFIAEDRDSIRYLGEAVPGISEKALAARLYFSDPALKHFKPVFRNIVFIVYKLTEDPDAAETKLFPYLPIYDKDLYVKEGGFYKNTQQTYDNVILPYAQKVNAASNLLNMEKPLIAVNLLKPLVEKIPRGSEAVLLLGYAYTKLRQFKEAEELLRGYFAITKSEYLAVEPLAENMLELLADDLYYQGRLNESFEILLKILKLPSHKPEIYKKMAILKDLDNDRAAAEKYVKLYEESLKH